MITGQAWLERSNGSLEYAIQLAEQEKLAGVEFVFQEPWMTVGWHVPANDTPSLVVCVVGGVFAALR